MDGKQDMAKQLARYGDLHRRIHETFLRRSESSEAWIEWQKACHDFHSYESPLRFIEEADARKRLREGDPLIVERALVFLELDPYVFRSGYTKAVIIRCIKRLSLTQEQIQRLQGVVLQAVDTYDRAEFRAYCRLAAVVDSPSFEEAIRVRLKSPDAAISRRANYVLESLMDWRRGFS